MERKTLPSSYRRGHYSKESSYPFIIVTVAVERVQVLNIQGPCWSNTEVHDSGFGWPTEAAR
jgi:hypothetical protein